MNAVSYASTLTRYHVECMLQRFVLFEECTYALFTHNDLKFANIITLVYITLLYT